MTNFITSTFRKQSETRRRKSASREPPSDGVPAESSFPTSQPSPPITRKGSHLMFTYQIEEVGTSTPGTAAELDSPPRDYQELQATWELIETGAYTEVNDRLISKQRPATLGGTPLYTSLSDPPVYERISVTATPKIKISVNSKTLELKPDDSITLSLLGVGPHNFMYLDGEFVPTTRYGTPKGRIIVPKDGMKIETQKYPGFKPISWIFRIWMKVMALQTWRKITKALESPWGRVYMNSFMTLLLAYLARPSLSTSTLAAFNITMTIISTAKMFDLVLNQTLVKLSHESKLSTSHVLFVLTVCEMSVLIAAGKTERFGDCAKLVEWHLLPCMLVIWVFGRRVIRLFWRWIERWAVEETSFPAVTVAVVAGRDGEDQTRIKKATSTSTEATKPGQWKELLGGLVGVLPCVLILLAFILDIWWRSGVTVTHSFSCEMKYVDRPTWKTLDGQGYSSSSNRVML